MIPGVVMVNAVGVVRLPAVKIKATASPATSANYVQSDVVRTNMSLQEDTSDPTSSGEQMSFTDPQVKQAVHEMDRQRCVNCLRQRESTKLLDVHHGVPRGAGGSERYTNLQSVCRRCHDAIHNDTIAPCVQLESTGRMTDVEFHWYKHFIKQIVPALARVADVRVQPKYNLDSEKAWYVPLGDLRRLDEQLADLDGQYAPLSLAEYM
jgi:HNH endonuclease.